MSASLKKLSAGKKANDTIAFLSNLGNSLSSLNAHSSSIQGLEKIVTAMNNLASVGSLAKATNGLSRIAPALESLRSVDVADASEKLQTLTKAMSGISELKGLSGFASSLRALKDLPEITSKMSPEVLEAFTEKVSKIIEVVSPLSEKMTSVKQGFQAINQPVRESTEAVDKFSSAIKNINLESVINILSKGIDLGKQAWDMLIKLTDDIVDLDGIIERFNRGFGSGAQEAYTWIQRLNKEMGINVQQFMQYTSIFAQMLEGLGVAQKDASQMAIGYSELAYDIWAAYNDIYEGYSDAVAAVQSGIAGQTRPLRRAGFSVLNTTLQQTAANHGLTISVQNATEAEKSYLRYLSLVDQAQAQGIVGTYAKEMNTAEGMLRTLGQQMKTLSQEAGNLLLPLLTTVVPRVQAAVRIISGYIKQLAALFGVTLRTPEWDTGVGGFTEALEDAEDASDGIAAGVGGAAASAKELKKTLLGIDEINQLNGQDKSSGGGGGGGGASASDIGSGLDWDVSSLWTEAIFKDINRQVDEIEAKFRELIPVLEYAGLIAGGIGLALLLKDLDESVPKMTDLQKIAIGVGAALIDIALNVAFTEVVLSADSADARTQIFGILGEWLASAGAGLVIGKVMGNTTTGLAIGLALGVVTQISTVSVELAHGNTRLTDSNFWVQEISSLLMGGLAGFAFLGGPTGLIVGLIATLALEVASVAIAWANGGAAHQGLYDAFGEGLGLTDKEIRLYVEDVVLTPRTITIGGETMTQQSAVDMLANVKVNIEQAKQSMQEAMSSLSVDVVKMKLGVTVDEQTLAADVQKYVNSVQSYIDNTYQEGALSLSLLGLQDSSMQSFLDGMYDSNIYQLTGMLQELATKGTMTSELGITFEVPEEQRAYAIMELQKQIQELVDEAAQMRYDAELTGLQLRTQGNLGGEEIIKAIDEATAIAASRISAFDDSMDTAIQIAYAEYLQKIKEGLPEADAKELYEANLNAIYQGWATDIIAINGDVMSFGMNKLKEGFTEEIPLLYEDYIKIIGNSSHASFGELQSDMKSYFQTWGYSISDTARAAMNAILESLMPTTQETQRVVKTLQESGQQIDQGLIDGINDTMKLAALTGSADAINYMVGYEFSKSDSFRKALYEAGIGFENFDEYTKNGILNNMDVVLDASGTVVTGVKNRLTGEVIEITPEVIEAFKKLGIDLTKGFSNGVSSTTSKKQVYDSTFMTIGEAVRAGETVLDEHSPSKVFFNLGVNAILGFKNGVGDPNTINGMLSTVETTFSKIRPRAELGLGSVVGNKWGRGSVGDVVKGVDERLGDVTSAAERVRARLDLDTTTNISNMRRVGRNLVQGIVDGMKEESESENTTRKINAVVAKLDQVTQKGALIGSPSKLFRDDVGRWLTAGIVEGMDQPEALVDPLKTMYGNAEDWWKSNTASIADGSIFSAENDTGKEHYMNLKDANNESNALLREQNELLRAILEKDTEAGYYGTTGEAMLQAASHLNRKTGRTMIPVGG